ncbi:MAG TPA: hypothetical protein VLB04_03790 [Methanotrichaceae archaeon]|nr:hypothetical protein [Methanotrichaceae archaeon]
MYRKLIAFLLMAVLYSCAVLSLASANDYVWITVVDSRGVQYANFDIYAYGCYVPGIGISQSPQFIGNTGSTAWLGWGDYITGSYKFEARKDGRVRGSKNVWLNGNQQNIYIKIK